MGRGTYLVGRSWVKLICLGMLHLVCLGIVNLGWLGTTDFLVLLVCHNGGDEVVTCGVLDHLWFVTE